MSGEVTQLLERWRNGDDSAVDLLAPMIYRELHQIAQRLMRGEHAGHTLQPTALVHEAFIRLLGSDVAFNDHRHFFCIAAKQMRHVLVDHARSKHRKKRGGQDVRVSWDLALAVYQSPDNPFDDDVLALHEALSALGKVDTRKETIVELHYFAGLAIHDIAELMRLSDVTVKRDLRFARAWMLDYLQDMDNETT